VEEDKENLKSIAQEQRGVAVEVGATVAVDWIQMAAGRSWDVAERRWHSEEPPSALNLE
jgi:hypothetical protein